MNELGYRIMVLGFNLRFHIAEPSGYEYQIFILIFVHIHSNTFCSVVYIYIYADSHPILISDS
jgi:hypothetical protein